MKNVKRWASFDVDAQNSFTPLCPDELPVAEGDGIVAHLNRMSINAALRVGSKDAHSPDAQWVVDSHANMGLPTGLDNADITWVKHCVPGTFGFELIEGLPAPVNYDYFIWKGVEPDLHPYGACYHDLGNRLSTGVIEYLRANQVTDVLVGGLALDYCVKTTAIQLVTAGFNVYVYLPATKAISQEGAVQAMDEMGKLGITLLRDESKLTLLGV